MTTLTRPVTTRDMKLILAGRTVASIQSLTLDLDSGLAQREVLSRSYKEKVKTKKEYDVSFDAYIDDMEAFGLVMGDYEVDPTKTESISMTLNPNPLDVKHIQGSHASDISVAGGNELAQKFVAAGEELSLLKLYTTTGGDSNCTVTIETDNSGEPSGTPVTNGTATGVDFSGSGWVTVSFSNNPQLTKGTDYWIVVSVPTTSTPISRSDTDIYTDWGYMENTGTWGTLQDNDLAFQLTTTDNSTILQVELTDGSNTHTMDILIAPGTASMDLSLEEPIMASLDAKSNSVTFSG